MKNLLKKLHMMSNQSEDAVEGSTSSKGNNNNNNNNKSSDVSSSTHSPDNNKPLSVLSNLLNSVANRKSPSSPSSSNVKREKTSMESTDLATTSGLEAALDAVRRDSGSSNSKDPDVEEEYQIQLALELSAGEDPEAAQIEAVKQISLCSCDPENTLAEVVAFRY